MAKYQGRYSASSSPDDGRTPATPPAEPRPAAANPRRRKRQTPPRYDQLLAVLWAAVAVPELILHISTAQGVTSFFSSGLILSLLFAAVPALIVWAVMLVVPKPKINFIIVLVFSALFFLMPASQLIYYRVFGTFYSAYSMANGGQVLQFWNIVLKKIFTNLPLLALMALPLLFLAIFGKKHFSFRRMKFPLFAAAPVLAAVILQLLLILCLPIFGGKEPMSAYDLYHNTNDSYFSVNKLGLFTAFRLDIQTQLFGGNEGGSISIDPPLNPVNPQPSTEPSGSETNPTGGETEPGATTAPTIDTSPNVLQIDFDALIADSINNKVTEVHQYFQSRTPSNKNEYTGLFKGNNLILITGEAFSHLAVSEELTPTLYKMMHSGIQLTNYYVPDWGVSTTDGEYGFLTGTIPKAGVWSFSKSSDNYMPLTMAQQLIGLGYNAYAYHGHTYTYYDRNQYLENLGYTYKAYGQGLDIKKTWPESDLEVMDVTTGDYTGKEPFTAYYMSISGHREFTFSGNYIANKNKSLTAHLPYSNNGRAYLSCQLELEFAMKLLLERLEEAGVLENTVIVLTADHYPNGLTTEELSELAGHDIETNFEIFKNGCIIYKHGMEPVVIDEPTSHLDLLPTLSNLFGLEFDSRLYMGRDVFSDAPALVMFRNRSWITEYASYNYNTGEVTSFTETPVTDDYVKQIKNELNNRFTVSARILDYDYWSILFDE